MYMDNVFTYPASMKNEEAGQPNKMSAGFLSPWFGYGILSLLCLMLPNSFGSITLTVSPSSDVKENQIVTLQCSYESNPISAKFYSRRNSFSSFCNLQYSGGVCKQSECARTYTTSCPNNTTYSVQYPVPQSWNGASVYCSNLQGNERSKQVTFSVTVPVTSLTLSPTQITVDVGRQIDLTCQTNYCNPAANITWYKSSTVISGQVTSTTDSNSDGFLRTTSVLTFTGVSGDNGQQVYCIAINRQGHRVQSNKGLLNVRYPPSSDPVITASPPGVQYDSGTRVSLTCQVSGGNPVATLSWRCIGMGMIGSNKSNTTTAISVLSLVMDSSFNNNQCTCTANHPLLIWTKSDSALLTVFYAPSAAPQLTGSTSVNERQSITLRCTLSTLGNPPITWSWVYGGDTLTTGATNTGTQSILILTVNREYNQRIYQCRATSPRPSLSYNRTSATHTITVYYTPTAAPQLTAIESTSVDERQNITLRCTLSTLGNPSITWSWVCGYDTLTTGVTNTGTQSVLTLAANRKYNQRNCYCRAESRRSSLSYDRRSETQTITVYYNSVITSISRYRYDIDEHENLRMNCDVEGNPLPNITWFFVENNTVVKTDVGSSSLNILSANCLDHGTYKITAENGEGPADTRTIPVTVRCKPRLYYAESQTPDKLGIGNDESLEILVRMVMYPPASIQWIFVGQNGESRVIQNNAGGYNITDTKRKNKHNSSLYKRRVNTEDFGYYTIVVLNDVGTFTRIYHVHEASVQETWMIVGSVVGSVAFIVVVLVILVIFLRRRYNCTCMIKIERKEENVKAADASEDRPGISETEQNVQGESQTYENVGGSSAEKKYENMLKVSKKQDEQDQTYCNTKTIAPNDVAIYEIMQGASASADNTYEDMSTGIKKQNKRGKTSKKTKMIAPTDVYVNTSFHK